MSGPGNTLHWEVARPQEELFDEDLDIVWRKHPHASITYMHVYAHRRSVFFSSFFSHCLCQCRRDITEEIIREMTEKAQILTKWQGSQKVHARHPDLRMALLFCLLFIVVVLVVFTFSGVHPYLRAVLAGEATREAAKKNTRTHCRE